MTEKLQYGGQAVIEGVMMRSPRWFAVACRKPDGSITIKTEAVENTILGKLKALNRPFLRGTLALLDALALGMKALQFSAQVQAEAIEEQSETPPKSARISDIAIGATMVGALLFGLVLFVAIPTLATQLAQPYLGIAKGGIPTYRQQMGLNVVDGAIRMTIFLCYVALIGRMENIRRVFQFHGAEHKAINALESGDELTVENAAKASRIHPRCGTSFVIIVLLAGIVVHCFFPRPENYFVRLGLHLAVIPLVAGIGYEIIRIAGKYRHVPVVNWALAPGLWTQRLTTREPDDSHIEVALASLIAVMQRERGDVPDGTPDAAAAAVA